MRLPALLVLLVALAGCGGTQTTSTFGDVGIVLPDPPGADEAGVYFALARGYDEAEGVTLKPANEGDFRLVAEPPEGCVPVMAVVRPDRLVLCVDSVVLTESRPKAVAVVRALMRGYTRAQLEPEEAVEAMMGEVPGLDRDALSRALDDAAPSWTAGAPYLGELPGSSVAADARNG
jgi:hypothetical protein